jgi:hypothetical protein
VYAEAVIDFEVLNNNTAPTINWWWWFETSSGQSSESNGTADTEFLATENKTVFFKHTSTDPDSDPLTYSWLINGTVNATIGNITWRVPFDYSNATIVNATLMVTDSKGASVQQEWNLTVISVNLPPKLYSNIPNQTWAENMRETLNITERLRDPDGDNLTFTYDLTPNCQATSCMTISFSGTSSDYAATFTPANNWWGITNVTITANDSQYTATSNSFALNVTYVPRQTQYVTVTSGGGGGRSGGSQVATLSMTIDPFVTIIPKEIVKAPILLENTGEVTLNIVGLSAEVADADGDISLLLGNTSFKKIDVNGNVSTYLVINVTNAKKERYEIRVIANVSSPVLNETSTIYLRTTPTNVTETEIRIEFVKDLFEDNPECMELMEIVFQAEEALDSENMGKAKNLTKTAIDNCRDLIKYGQVSGRLPSQAQPFAINLQPLDVAIVFAVAIVAWFVLKLSLRKKRFGSGRSRFMPSKQT